MQLTELLPQLIAAFEGDLQSLKREGRLGKSVVRHDFQGR
jgi:hypothetical protein